MEKFLAVSSSNYDGDGDASTSTSALSASSSIDVIKGSTTALSLNDYADNEEDEDVCRICRNPGDTENPLRFPCVCRGSIKYVHQGCLLQWLNRSNARQCEVCKYPFKFSPVYAENAPTKLPIQEFIAGIAKKICYIIRLSFVLSVYLLIIPYINYLVYKLAFVRSFGEAQRVFLSHISTTNILTDCLYGFLLSFTIATFGGGAFLVWEWDYFFNELNVANREFDVPFAEAIGLWGPLFPFVECSFAILLIYTILFGVVIFVPLCLGRVILPYMFSKESSNLVTLGVGYMVIISLLILYLGIVELIRYTKGESSIIMGRLNLHFDGETMNMLKVALFSVICYVAHSLICGWFLDLSIIGMFTSSFIHWLVGVLFMALLGIFVRLLEEVLIIGQIFGLDLSEACNILVAGMLFGSLIIATWIAPSIFPLDISVLDVYTEVPALMLLYEIRIPLANFMFTIVCSWLSLTKFLLQRPDYEKQNEDIGGTNSQNVTFDEVDIVHMVLLVIIVAWMTLLVINTGLIIISVSLGRALFTAIYLLPIINGIKLNDMYAFIMGSYVIWAIIAGVRYCIEQIRSRKVKLLWNNIRKWSVILVKTSALLSIWILVIPVVIGLIIQLLVIVPMRVPLDESPVFLLYQDWALGLISFKIWTTLVIPWMDDTWQAKLERVRENGFARVECIWVLREIIVPILKKLLTALCVPYVLARGVFPVFGFSLVVNSLVYRFAWLGCLGLCLVWYCVKRFHVWFTYFHNYIRDERYLIGRTLHDFEPQLANQTAASSPESVVGDVFPAIQHEGSI